MEVNPHGGYGYVRGLYSTLEKAEAAQALALSREPRLAHCLAIEYRTLDE
jgi:hypothetical protein